MRVFIDLSGGRHTMSARWFRRREDAAAGGRPQGRP